MPDTRNHRGAHPGDRELFAHNQLPVLRTSDADLSLLMTRGYSMKAALKLVGDRHELTDRQRLAVSRADCSDQSKEHRAATNLPAEAVAGEELIIDGFNLIITIEAALSGGVLIHCRDGCLRDLSSVHGSYRSVNETDQAISLIGTALEDLGPKSVAWLLDRPISNSGRLAKRIRDLETENNWNWTVEVLFNPDAEIITSGRVVISSDSHVLDETDRWTNLNRYLLDHRLKKFWLMDLSG